MLELADFARRVTQGGTQQAVGGGGENSVVDIGSAVVACFPCDPAAYRQIAAVALRELLGMVPSTVMISIGRWDKEQQQEEEEERQRRNNNEQPSVGAAFGGGSSVGIGGIGIGGAGAALFNGIDFGEVGSVGGGGSVLPGTPRGSSQQQEQRQQQSSTEQQHCITPSKLWALATTQAAAAAAAASAAARGGGPSSSSSSLTLRCAAEAEVLPLLGLGENQEVRARPLCPCHGAPLFDRVGSAAWPAMLCTVTGEPVLPPPVTQSSSQLSTSVASGGFGRSLLVGGAHPLQLGARARPSAARNPIILPPKGRAGGEAAAALPPPVLTAVVRFFFFFFGVARRRASNVNSLSLFFLSLSSSLFLPRLIKRPVSSSGTSPPRCSSAARSSSPRTHSKEKKEPPPPTPPQPPPTPPRPLSKGSPRSLRLCERATPGSSASATALCASLGRRPFPAALAAVWAAGSRPRHSTCSGPGAAARR